MLTDHFTSKKKNPTLFISLIILYLIMKVFVKTSGDPLSDRLLSEAFSAHGLICNPQSFAGTYFADPCRKKKKAETDAFVKSSSLKINVFCITSRSRD